MGKKNKVLKERQKKARPPNEQTRMANKPISKLQTGKVKMTMNKPVLKTMQMDGRKNHQTGNKLQWKTKQRIKSRLEALIMMVYRLRLNTKLLVIHQTNYL